MRPYQRHPRGPPQRNRHDMRRRQDGPPLWRWRGRRARRRRGRGGAWWGRRADGPDDRRGNEDEPEPGPVREAQYKHKAYPFLWSPRDTTPVACDQPIVLGAWSVNNRKKYYRSSHRIVSYRRSSIRVGTAGASAPGLRGGALVVARGRCATRARRPTTSPSPTPPSPTSPSSTRYAKQERRWSAAVRVWPGETTSLAERRVLPFFLPSLGQTYP